MREIVIYHNDINRVNLTSELSEQEQNLFFGIIALIRGKIDNPIIELKPQDISKMLGKNLSNRELTDILTSFEQKFFKADFTILLKEGNLVGKMRAHFFNHFVVWKEPKKSFDMNTGDCDFWDEFTHINLEVNEYFEYLVNELTANFTRFELVEFIALKGKYTKTLYRLLKQYRNTGYMRMEWDEFVRVMGISYTRQIDIDQRILKPAIKELTKPRNLFDMERVPFKNLQYKKLKSGGNKIVAIEFRFSIETETIQSNDYFTEAYQAKIKALEGRYIDKMRIDGSWLLIDKVEFDYGAGKIKLRLGEKGKKDSIRKRYTKEELEKEVLPFISKEFK